MLQVEHSSGWSRCVLGTGYRQRSVRTWPGRTLLRGCQYGVHGEKWAPQLVGGLTLVIIIEFVVFILGTGQIRPISIINSFTGGV